MNLRSEMREIAGSRRSSRLRWALLAVASVILILARVAPAQEPPSRQSENPVRLKKKPKAEQPSKGTDDQSSKQIKDKAPVKPAPVKPPQQDKGTRPQEDRQAQAIQSQEKLQETMERLTKDFSLVQERLKKADPGKQTQQTQGDIIKGLDELIEQTKEPSAQQQADQQQASRQNDSTANKQRRRRGVAQRGERPMASPQVGSRPVGGRGFLSGSPAKAGEPNKLEELYKDVWGHLPETLRQEMNQYAREQFMAKYGDLLKQYYATIAEKGRRNQGSGVRDQERGIRR